MNSNISVKNYGSLTELSQNTNVSQQISFHFIRQTFVILIFVFEVNKHLSN